MNLDANELRFLIWDGTTVHTVVGVLIDDDDGDALKVVDESGGDVAVFKQWVWWKRADAALTTEEVEVTDE